MNKTLLTIIGVIFLTGCGAGTEADYKSEVQSVARAEVKTAGDSEKTLPARFNLDVPFYPQAPDADWGYPWQEACEEASLTLAYYFVEDKSLTKEQFRQEILTLVEWENERFGDYWHTTVDQTAQMLKEHFGHNDYKILNDPTIDDLKKELAQGHPIVAPFAGRELKNPFYSGIGPVYHMLVIKGYDEKNFITNDVGTRRGKDFIFPYARLMGALHDYNADDMDKGPKKVLVLY